MLMSMNPDQQIMTMNPAPSKSGPHAFTENGVPQCTTKSVRYLFRVTNCVDTEKERKEVI